MLDIATGYRRTSYNLANKVGSGGHVLAMDISPLMLSVAKQELSPWVYKTIIEFKEGDIETIDLPSSSI